MPADHQLIDSIRAFLAAVERVWERYLDVGPGKVEAGLYDDVVAVGAFVRSDESLASVVEDLRELCHRCCCRSEGLCFITGEAGLIPRRDLHERLERGLEELRGLVVRAKR